MSSSSKAVFLSYASQDADAARHIHDALQVAGVEVWFDQSARSRGRRQVIADVAASEYEAVDEVSWWQRSARVTTIALRAIAEKLLPRREE